MHIHREFQQPNNERLNRVEKVYFEIQVNAFVKKIVRLKAAIKASKKEINTVKNNTKRINDNFKKEVESVQKLMEEKKTHREKLEMEITSLLKKSKALSEHRANRMAELYDEFIKESNHLKSRLAVLAGRSERFERFIEQKDMIRQKIADMREEMASSKEKHETKMKNLAAETNRMKKEVQLSFVHKTVNVAEQMHLNLDPFVARSFHEVIERQHQLDACESMISENEKTVADAREATSRIVTDSVQQCRQMNAEKHRFEQKLKDLEREVAEEQAQVEDLQKQVRQRESREAEEAAVAERMLAAVKAKRNVRRMQTELRKIENTDEVLDLHILHVEDVLLKIYEEAAVHVEHMQYDETSGEEDMMEFIKKLSEMKPFTVPKIFTVDHLDNFALLAEDEHSHNIT